MEERNAIIVSALLPLVSICLFIIEQVVQTGSVFGPVGAVIMLTLPFVALGFAIYPRVKTNTSSFVHILVLIYTSIFALISLLLIIFIFSFSGMGFA